MSIPLIWEIEDFITPETCAEIIQMCEAKDPGLDQSIELVSKNDNLVSPFKNQYRIRFSDTDIQRIVQAAIDKQNCNATFKIGGSFSFVSYHDGGFIRRHIDKNKEKVKHTIIIYLNNDYLNGETFIVTIDNSNLKIIPKTGKALIFEGTSIEHGCHEVNGIKKILVCKVEISLFTQQP